MNTSAPPRTAAFFDLDKTIIAKSSTLAFGRSFYRGGLINRRAVLTTSLAHLRYRLRGADHHQMERMRAYLGQLSRGWDVNQVRDIVTEAIEDLIQPFIYEEAARLIDEHHAAGREVILVSSSGSEIVGPIGELLGADRVIATRLTVEDGRYTGALDFYSYREHKAAAVRELAEAAGYDLSRSYAYSDSATDLPLLEAVGRPHAVNPDRALRRVALERGWPVLTFTRSVRLDRKLPLLTPATVLVAAIVAATVAGALLYLVRRRFNAEVRRVVAEQAEIESARRGRFHRHVRGQHS